MGRGMSRSGNSAFEWARRQALQIEAVHVLKQLHEGACSVIERPLALVAGGKRRVAYRAGRVQILSHPAEARRTVGAELGELLFHGERRRHEVAGLVLAYGLRPAGEHDRGLDIAAVDAVDTF